MTNGSRYKTLFFLNRIDHEIYVTHNNADRISAITKQKHDRRNEYIDTLSNNNNSMLTS